MATKNDIIAAVQAVADGTGVVNLRLSMGTPGDYLDDAAGEARPTGASWAPEPKVWSVFVEGLANWLDSGGIGGPPRFMVPQSLGASANINNGTDLALLTAGGITASLPDPTTVPPFMQVVVKNTGLGGNFLNVQGGANIDAGPVLGVPGIFDAVRVFTDGAQWWTW